jgi:molecular chaperone GrpE
MAGMPGKKGPMMSDLDEVAGAPQNAGNPQGSLAPEDRSFPLDDEAGLEVLEGLAQEDKTAAGPASDAGRSASADGTIGASGDLWLRDALKELSQDLGRRLELLRSMFERESRAEVTRERVIDRLHAELQEYKQDLLLKVQRPIFVDLIQLHDDIGKMIEARTPSDAGAERTASAQGILESIQTAIEDILYRQGVEPFALEGTEFDARKQRAISTLATEDPALNKTVAVRLRKGFIAGDKLIRPEIVSVFTLRPAPPPAEG